MAERWDNNSGISITGGNIVNGQTAIGSQASVFYSSPTHADGEWSLRSIEPQVRAMGERSPLEVERIIRVLRQVWPPDSPATPHELTVAMERFREALRLEFRHSSDLNSVVGLYETLMRMIFGDGRTGPLPTVDVPVSIYVDDESAGPDVERAVIELLDQLGLPVVQADPPIRRSWFRRMRARSRLMVDSPEFAELMAKTTRALELRALDQVQAQVDAGQGDAAAKIITALGASKIRNAVVQVGSILAVKVEDEITVRTLTQLEMAVLTRQPDLLRNPRGILLALRMEVEQTAALPGAQTARSGQ